jgi:hypothetical protein
MPQVKKRKRLHKKQYRIFNGRFGSKIPINNKNELGDYDEGKDGIGLDVAGIEEGWGDDDDSGWEDEINLTKEKAIQSKFMIGNYSFI